MSSGTWVFDNSHSSGVRRHLIVGLICVSLVISHAEHFSYLWWPFVCLFLRNAYLGLLSIFQWIIWGHWVPYFSGCWVLVRC
jgi:hypothetical protein